MIIVSDSAAVEAVSSLGKMVSLEACDPARLSWTRAPHQSGGESSNGQPNRSKTAKLAGCARDCSKHNEAKGELTFMMGGDRAALDRAMPVLQALGKRHIYCGSKRRWAFGEAGSKCNPGVDGRSVF